MNFDSSPQSSSNSQQQISTEKSPSIDALIDRIHTLARAMHDLGQSANSHAQEIATRGEETVGKFDSNFGAITTGVERIYGAANHRVEEVPVGMLIAFGCTLGILLVLMMAWIGGILVEKFLKRIWRRRETE